MNTSQYEETVPIKRAIRTFIRMWCYTYTVASLRHAPAQLWLQQDQQGLGRSALGGACSGMWDLTNQSRFGFLGGTALKREAIVGLQQWPVWENKYIFWTFKRNEILWRKSITSKGIPTISSPWVKQSKVPLWWTLSQNVQPLTNSKLS